MVFYPGSLWMRRLGHLFILCTIGINMFLSDVQNALLMIGEDMIIRAKRVANPALDVAYMLEHNIVPAVGFLEESRFNWIIDEYGIPDTRTLKEGIAHTYALSDALRRYAPIYTDLSLILQILNVFFWASIAFSGYWILMDIIKSKARLFDIPVVLGAIWWNMVSYGWLVGQFDLERFLIM